MAGLAVYLLGPPRVERDGETLHISRRKALALLAYLAVERHSHRRDSLATLFWPEHDQSRARAYLRVALSELNRALGGGFLAVDRETVALEPKPDMWVDADRFHALLEVCETHDHSPTIICRDCLPSLEEAVALYENDFLAGFTLRDSPDFDEWQFFQTEGLRGELASVLERLVGYHRTLGESEMAIAHARRWLSLDPLHEPAHRELMALYAQAGQQSAALRQYQVCEDTLAAELGFTPSPETTALYERIRSGTDETDVLTILERPPAPRFAHNLPSEVTPFVGRAKELAGIDERLADPDCRLLTLVGPGGIGKTRLAIQAARVLIQVPPAETRFSHGLFFVPLAPVSETDELVPSIASTLGMFFDGVSDPRQQLLNYLRERALLLVLDNFEHLLGGIDLVTDILIAAPSAKIMITSREALNLRQEWLYPVDGLRVPAAEAVDAVEETAIQAHSAVELFVQSARRANAGFSFSEEKHWVVRICQLVEGMPLAIELAAAWVRHMPCPTIAHELENGIELLTTSLRDVPERHRSLLAVCEQSWQLLLADEREVLSKLSVFRGGFQREAAEMVTGASLLLLSALVDKSLLRVDPGGRYHLHEHVRQFAAEKLEQFPIEVGATQQRHGFYYLSFLQQREQDLKGPGIAQALSALRSDIHNVRLAWDWAVEHDCWGELTAAAEGLSLFHDIQGWFLEGKNAFDKAVGKLRPQYGRPETGEEPAPRGTVGIASGVALTYLSGFHSRLGHYEQAQALIEESLTILRAEGHEAQWATARALRHLGSVIWFQGELVAAREPLQDSYVLFDEVGDRWGSARALFSLGQATLELGQYAEAEQLLQESRALFDEIGEQRQVVYAISNLGRVAEARGQYAQAELLHRECLERRTALGDRPGMSHTLGDLGDVARLQRHPNQAKAYYEQSLVIAKDTGNPTQFAVSLWGLSRLAEMQGEYAEADRLAQSSKAYYQLITSDLCMGWAKLGLGDYAAAEQCFRGVLVLASEAAWSRKALESLSGYAHLLAKARQPERALEVLALILGHPCSDEQVRDRAARLESKLTTELTADAVAAACERGQARDLWEMAEALLEELPVYWDANPALESPS